MNLHALSVVKEHTSITMISVRDVHFPALHAPVPISVALALLDSINLGESAEQKIIKKDALSTVEPITVPLSPVDTIEQVDPNPGNVP